MGCWLVSFHARLLISVALSQLMQNERGETALFATSSGGHLETATLLLQYGAVVDYQSKVRLLLICPWSTIMVWHRMVCSVEQGRALYICMVITVYGSLMHVHVVTSATCLCLCAFVHVVGGGGGMTLCCCYL